MDKNVTSILMDTSVLAKVLQMQGTTKKSTAVLSCLYDFMSLDKKEKKKISQKHFLLLTKGYDNYEKLSIRIPQNIKEALCQAFPNVDISDAENWICAYFINSSPPNSPKSLHLLRVSGSKWNPKMQDAISGILKSCNRTWSTRIETCAGALGSFAPFPLGDTEILNDVDVDKFNLYKVIQKSSVALLRECRKYPVNRDFFISMKQLDPSALSNVKKAARYLYLNLTSYKNMEDTFNTSNTIPSFYAKTIASIPDLSKRLANVKLMQRDLFNALNDRNAGTLYVVDPPYLDTAYIYKAANEELDTFTWHQTLARKLLNLHNTHGCDFILFCRITGRKKDQNKLGAEADLYMEARINALYAGKGVFYKDVEIDDSTTERIITSFNFNGATPYI